ncbi:hypothetical protein CJ030_MR6G006735 [Morella rubra]|uniref:F-box domain-containing protein n=1 Tax=Morella rubra TaxID=262757 RepID=A0A6A1V7G6_9ROSI|nr:hypothetical protein CJ030_MR6G006734 [Morella rubra]KAB1208694.1 hypothetical protein CJ030_MR6G006735 [Morella rubra]
MDSDFEMEGGRKRSKLEGEEPTSCRLESLPSELIHEIVSGLPVSSLVQFKSVCSAWRMLSRDPDLVNMHTTRMAENNPCLIFHCDYPIRNQLYFVELPVCIDKKEKVKKLRVPFWAAMPEFDVVGSCNGLLCLSDSLYSDAIYIYNPFTRDYLVLPKSMQYCNQEVVFGFGFHPTTKEYKVIKIIYYRKEDRGYRRAFRLTNTNSEVQIFTLGCSNWRSMGKVAYHLLQPLSQVLVNGRLHWVTRPRRYSPRRSIISFDLADEQFQEVPTPDCNTLNRRKYHLVVLGGCLSAAVYCNYGKLEIWVMREYGVKESWIKKLNIGNYVPKGLEKDVNQSFKISKIITKGRFVRVLCLLKNAEILLEYKSRALVAYDPVSGKFKDLTFQGIPKWFQAVVHVGSLNWIETSIDA